MADEWKQHVEELKGILAAAFEIPGWLDIRACASAQVASAVRKQDLKSDSRARCELLSMLGLPRDHRG